MGTRLYFPTIYNILYAERIPKTLFQVANSNAIEKKGFCEVMDRLLDQGVDIAEVSTDRHNQIRKLM